MVHRAPERSTGLGFTDQRGKGCSARMARDPGHPLARAQPGAQSLEAQLCKTKAAWSSQGVWTHPTTCGTMEGACDSEAPPLLQRPGKDPAP